MEMFPVKFPDMHSLDLLSAEQWAEVLAYIVIREGEKAEEIHSICTSNIQGASL